MLKTSLILCIAVAGALASCASSSSTNKHQDNKALIAAMQAHNADPQNIDNKYVCKEELPTGTNIPIVVCRTQKDMEARRLADQMELESYLRRARSR